MGHPATTRLLSRVQDDTACYIMAEVPRPLPTDRRMAVRSLEYLAEATDREALAEAKEKLELFITETQDIGVRGVLGIENGAQGVPRPASPCPRSAAGAPHNFFS